jgi:hypothetical protein
VRVEHQAAWRRKAGIGRESAIALNAWRLYAPARECRHHSVQPDTVYALRGGVRQIQRTGGILHHAAERHRIESASERPVRDGSVIPPANPHHRQERAIRLEPEQRAHIVDQQPARQFVEEDAVYHIERGAEGWFAVDRIAMTVWQTGNRHDGLRTGKAQRHPGQRIPQAAHAFTIHHSGSGAV